MDNMGFHAPDPPDSSIAWCIQLYNSRPQKCLEYLRASYPDSRVVLLVDGDTTNDYANIAAQYNAELVLGEHLMKFDTCHAYVERLLLQALKGGERYFFRIDPDARIWRRFSWLPNSDCEFGTLETITAAYKDKIRHPPNIQGGCLGLTRGVIERILESNVLSHERCVEQARNGWVRNKDCEHSMAAKLMLDDFIISWAVDVAGFPITQHPEIASYWREVTENGNLQFAVTHPNKEMTNP